jgi:hypothetical protein
MIRFVLQSIKSLGASYKHEIELTCKYRMGSFNLEVETLFVNRVCICMLSIAIRIVVAMFSSSPRNCRCLCPWSPCWRHGEFCEKKSRLGRSSQSEAVKVGVPHNSPSKTNGWRQFSHREFWILGTQKLQFWHPEFWHPNFDIPNLRSSRSWAE